jgi:hypothetical protein
MRKILCAFVLVCSAMCALLAFAADRTLVDANGNEMVFKESSQPGFFRYDSDAGPFVVDIPACFTRLASVETDNRSETVVLSDDEGAAQFRMMGTRLVGELTIAQYYKASREELKVKPAYEKLGQDFFVLSWLRDGVIYYQKSVITGDCLGEMEISYPAERKKEFDPLVTHSAKSLK